MSMRDVSYIMSVTANILFSIAFIKRVQNDRKVIKVKCNILVDENENIKDTKEESEVTK